MNFLVFSSPSFMPRTKVCLASIKKYHPNSKIHLEMVEDPAPSESYIPGMANKRIQKMIDLLKENPNQELMLLGADCVLYQNIDNVITGGVTIFPHVITPPIRDGGQLYNTGHANGDLIIANESGLDVLEWLVKQDMSNKISEGIFYEQTWLSAAPFFFDNVYINKNPGYNFAYYNINERKLQKDHLGYYLQENEHKGRPYTYFLNVAQFSGYVLGKPERMSKYNKYEDATGATLELFKEYDALVRKNYEGS